MSPTALLPEIEQQTLTNTAAVAAPRRHSPGTIARVLHVINGEHYSGAERVQDLLAQQLPNLGFDVGFACVKPVRFAMARDSKGTPLVELPMRGRFDLNVVKQLARLIYHEEYDIVHAHTPRSALVASLAALQARVPLVYHVHSPAGRDSTNQISNWTNALVEQLTVRRAVRLIAVSPSLRTHMIEHGFGASKIVCVPNGVPALEGPIEHLAPEGPWTLGTIALFRPRKGLETLLEALALLRSQDVDVRLRVVGWFETPEYEHRIQTMVDRLTLGEAIELAGFTKNIREELAKIDLFVLPSLFGEGLPMVVLEAMAAGLPVVALRVEGVPDAVRHRETGLLVDPGSVSQLAAAIEEFITGHVDYSALSVAARHRHAESFSDTAMAAGVAAVYQDVLRGRLRVGD